MPYDQRHKENSYRYKKDHIKRVPFDMQKADYEELKAAAMRAGESVNGYIKKAIAERMQREGEKG